MEEPAAQSTPSAGIPFFELEDAVVRRNGNDILRIPSLVVYEQESVALLGPNGAGKSTLLHLLTREVLPLHREIPPVRFRGQARPLLSEVRSAVGIVSATMQEEINLHLSALDIVIGGLFGTVGIPLRHTVTEEEKAAAQRALDEMGIGSVAQQLMPTLSSGQQRRVLIARALIANPEVLVFDEPCTGLDPEGMFQVRKAMRHLAQTGRAIFLITHFPEDIIPEIQRVLLLKDGELFADGPKSELLTTPIMSELFAAPLQVEEHEGYYGLWSPY